MYQSDTRYCINIIRIIRLYSTAYIYLFTVYIFLPVFYTLLFISVQEYMYAFTYISVFEYYLVGRVNISKTMQNIPVVLSTAVSLMNRVTYYLINYRSNGSGKALEPAK